jgi:hypothetical protein
LPICPVLDAHTFHTPKEPRVSVLLRKLRTIVLKSQAELAVPSSAVATGTFDIPNTTEGGEPCAISDSWVE